MDAALRLHTFTRKACIGREDHYVKIIQARDKQYQMHDGQNCADDINDISPRLHVLRVVLEYIEWIDTDELPDFEQLMEFIIDIAKTASSWLTELTFSEQNKNDIYRRAVTDERQELIKIFSNITESDLEKIKPLFYRRTLNSAEVEYWEKNIQMSFGASWGVNEYLLSDSSSELNSAPAVWSVSDIDILQKKIRKFFADNAIERVIELRELEASYEIQADAVVMRYDAGGEKFWTAARNEWIVYCSHHGTITFAGKITEAISSS